MTRVRGTPWRYERTLPTMLALILGPCDDDDLTVEALRVAWEMEGVELMQNCFSNPNPAWRPAGWWLFVVGEERPADHAHEARRLAELGELRESERDILRQRAERSESWAKIWQAVQAGEVSALNLLQPRTTVG